MAHELPALPYKMDALKPHISKETLEYHYGKHHRAYCDKLNKLIIGTEFEVASLEDTIRGSRGAIFDCAAQLWNHTFYWQSLTPISKGDPEGPLAEAINRDFRSLDELKERFNEIARGHFGSGWAWLTKNPEGKLEIISTKDAVNPLTNDHTPLLTCDVWEHAYYIDYRHARAKYLEAFWHLVNWEFAAKNFG